ncbi:MAG: endonuclease/exonuclease/phosphatase family protein [Clostridia bacterium]|nr:endonuclease/exonuclease/phosphatase family protein [Clostridia bacterium]
MSRSLKFMTFNIRVAAGCDGINMFFNRAHRVVEVIEQEKPDVIGFQEVTDEMRAWLRDRIPGYTVQGCGRGRDYHGESMLLAYRTDDVEMISLDNLWLSPTPRVPGSRFTGDQSPCPRMLTTVLLKHNALDTPFRFINTHLDHEGRQARYLGSMELVQLISTYPERFVLTGDFNATPETPEIKLITEALKDRAPHGAVDCTAGLGTTFHAFGKLPNGPKIDYIFTDGLCKSSYVVEDIPVNGQYYSDHYAVVAEIDLED